MATAKQEELLALKAKLRKGGGDKAIEKQHAGGKHTARERLAMLFDEGSFVETGLFVKHRCTNFGMGSKDLAGDGVATGYGTIDGRLVYAYAQDFTVVGGSMGEMQGMKISKLQEAAMKAGAPVIGINDSGGARIQEGVDSLAGYGEIFYKNVMASGVVPQISVIMGPCAGGAVYSPALTDFIMMVKGTGQMYITGPNVIKAVTGEEVTAESLGGAMVHNGTTGCAHYAADSEEECFAQIHQLLSYLPSNNMDAPPVFACTDDINREDPALNDLVPENPNKAYDMLKVIEAIADNGEMMQYQEFFAPNVITAFIRLNGKSVGVVANQPKAMAGSLDVHSGDKVGRFVRTCDCYNIPVLTLEDVPGFMPGTQQEYQGIIRHGAKIIYAYTEATVPKVTVILRKAYGGAYIAMNSKHLGSDMVFAWPDSEVAVMGGAGAANIVFAKDIKAAADPEAERAKKIAEYNDTMMNPYVAASRGYVDDVILPSETRKYVIAAFEALQGKREDRPRKKHGNIPL